jgi:hypothetical protein
MVSGVKTSSDFDWEAGRASRGFVGRPRGWENIGGTLYGSNSEADSQAFGLSVLVTDEEVGVDVGEFEPAVIAFCGVVGADLDFWEKGISARGVSGSTMTRMADVNMNIL